MNELDIYIAPIHSIYHIGARCTLKNFSYKLLDVTFGIIPPYFARAHPIVFVMMVIHCFNTATFHAVPILAVMLSWFGT